MWSTKRCSHLEPPVVRSHLALKKSIERGAIREKTHANRQLLHLARWGGEGPFWPKIDPGPFWPKIDPGDAKQFRTSETTMLSPMFLMFKNPFALHQFIGYLPFSFVDLLTCFVVLFVLRFEVRN